MNNSSPIEALLDAAKDIGYGRVPPLQHHEEFTIGAFDLIIANTKQRSNVFSLLETLCSHYPDVKNDSKFLKGYIYLLSQFANSTNTTELPQGMREIISDNPEKTEDLQKWYRIQA
jgi:hypothetical protein